MAEIAEDRQYTKTHEWIKVEDNVATIGISEHAQELIGDLVFVDLPEVDLSVVKGDEVGVIESVKSASDFYAPQNGEVIEVNTSLNDHPELINTDPYNSGWIFKLRLANALDESQLLSSEEYKAQLSE